MTTMAFGLGKPSPGQLSFGQLYKNIFTEPTRCIALMDRIITPFDQIILDSGVLGRARLFKTNDVIS